VQVTSSNNIDDFTSSVNLLMLMAQWPFLIVTLLKFIQVLFYHYQVSMFLHWQIQFLHLSFAKLYSCGWLSYFPLIVIDFWAICHNLFYDWLNLNLKQWDCGICHIVNSIKLHMHNDNNKNKFQSSSYCYFVYQQLLFKVSLSVGNIDRQVCDVKFNCLIVKRIMVIIGCSRSMKTRIYTFEGIFTSVFVSWMGFNTITNISGSIATSSGKFIFGKMI